MRGLLTTRSPEGQSLMRNVLEWLEATSRRLPDKVGLADPDGQMTFSELERAARSAGTWLAREAGVRPRTAVALYLEKSCPALACMLGTVYAGGFYSVLDVRQPATRIRSICDALDPAVVLADEETLAEAQKVFEGTGMRVATLSEALACDPDDEVLALLRAQATDVDPLYVNFTSGSTGTPKGVVVSHRSVIDFIPVFVETFGMGEDDVFANQAPFDFDVSVKDIYSSLFTGARLQLVPRPYFSEPARLMDYLADTGATTLVWAVSALCFVSIMSGLEYRLPDRVNKVLFSGEVMPPKQLAKWQKYLPDALYVNLYGPTEITCNCTYYVVDRTFGKGETIPMGRPFPNERVFLLDDENHEVTEVGEEGEICVSGTALGLGYLGDANRTAEAFVQNPLNDRWLEQIYRTGDLARYDDNGDLVYASRKDHQIKHLGHRIELGDIESTTMSMDGVDQACCIYDSRRKRLHLFYVGEAEHDDLVAQLHEALPSFMMPNKVFNIEQMPLTKNGKIDRGALAAGRSARR